MTAASGIEHRLEGLEPDNLLAFMALLGLLRALERARPAWRPRVRWSLDEPPLRPVLVLREARDQGTIAAAAAEGVTTLAAAHEFDRSLLNFTQAQGREALTHSLADREQSDLWAALFSDAAVDEKKGLVRKTPLNFLDVAQVAFLKSLTLACAPAHTPKRGMAKAIEDACFQTWRRRDNTLSFRWDPIEDSRHAYRASAPSDDKQLIEYAGNALASVGLRSMTVMPSQSRGNVHLLARGVRADDGVAFMWPIWRPPVSLSAIEALLANPGPEATDGARLGVEMVMAASRLNAPGSKYRNVSRGRPLNK